MTSRFRDEFVVREFTFPSKCYPRFRYFQKSYEGLLPELKKVEEHASLYKIDYPEYKSLSDRNYDSIDVTVLCHASIANKPLESKLVKVQVSAKLDLEKKVAAKKDDDDKQVSANLDDEKQVSAKLDVEMQESAKLDDEKLVAAKFDDGKQESVELDDDEQEHYFPFHFFFFWDNLQSGRRDTKVLNITVFMINEKDLEVFELFMHLHMSEERMENAVLHDIESNVSSTYEDMVKNNFKFKYDEDNKTSTLSSTIQHILEYNIVSVLDEIVKFIGHIEEWPYKLQEKGKDFTDTLPDKMDKLNVGTRSEFQDEDKHLEQSPDMKEQPTEEDEKYKTVLKKCYDKLVAIMDPRLVIDQFELIEFLPLSTLRDIREIITTSGKNRQIVDIVLTKGTRGYMAFMKCLTETKQHELVALLSEFDVRLSPEWTTQLQEMQKQGFSEHPNPSKRPYHEMEQVQYEYIDLEQPSETKTQPSEEVANNLKKTMMTLKFEIFGLLRQTRIVQIRESVPKNPKLSCALKKEILKIPEIVGCGIAYGQIEMHISRKKHPNGPSDEIVNMVEQLLQEHNYSYTIELIGEKIELSFKQGDKTEASLIDKVEKKKETHFGTLGCFVNVKMANTDTLFGITCAHCVRNYDREIKIITIDRKEITGIRSHAVHWEECHNVDIAAIEIDRRDYEDCETSLRLGNYTKCQNWTFQEGYPDMGVPVYKRGYKTRLTQGRIHFSEHYDEDSDVSERVNPIVIKSCETASPFQQHLKGPFSAKGDSGSVVWYEYLGFSEEPVATVIGIIFRGDENELDGTIESTYCCPIKPSIKKLEERFGEICKIEPARESSKT